MSRVANQPVIIPSGVEVSITAGTISAKGPKGTLTEKIHDHVTVTKSESNDNPSSKVIKIESKPNRANSNALAGTMRSNVQNMIKGVSQGFEKSLELVGVGYRAKVEGRTVHLTLGYSHPVTYQLAEGVTAEAPSVTQIILRGADKQKVGQVAAEIREFRAPEPYKGKGVKYVNEQIVRKETKKK